MSEEDSCYSNDEEYFMDLCRGNEFEELKGFVESLPEDSLFDWTWFNYKSDNFMHMIAANQLPHIFDYLMPFLKKRCTRKQIDQILNMRNSSGSTPLHYAVISDSKEMVNKLIEEGADPNIPNQQNRTPFQEAEKFYKFEIAEILAPISKNDLEALKIQTANMKFDDNDSDDDDEDILQEIKQEQGKQEQGKQEQEIKEVSENADHEHQQKN